MKDISNDFKLPKINKQLLYIITTVLWICLIFSFSLQSGEDSSQISGGFGAWLMEHVFFMFSDMFASMSADEWDMFHFLIRKCAHFSEFFVLGVLMLQTLRQKEAIFKVIHKTTHKAELGLLLCMMVAMIDETIQLFVPERAGRFADVLLDSSGSLTGICMVLLLTKCRQKIYNRKKLESRGKQ